MCGQAVDGIGIVTGLVGVGDAHGLAVGHGSLVGVDHLSRLRVDEEDGDLNVWYLSTFGMRDRLFGFPVRLEELVGV